MGKAVQDVKRTNKIAGSALGPRVGRTIKETEEVFAWMVEHASELLNRCVVRHDGKTSYEIIKGRALRRPTVEFSEGVLAMGPRGAKDHEKGGRWTEAIWLVMNDESEESLVYI